MSATVQPACVEMHVPKYTLISEDTPKGGRTHDSITPAADACAVKGDAYAVGPQQGNCLLLVILACN